MQKLVLSAPAEQAEVVAAAQREFELAPTPSHQLRFALILATARAHRHRFAACSAVAA